MAKANQTEEYMWESISVRCKRDYNLVRSANSLRHFWSKLARQSMHYISSMALVATSTKGQSGATTPLRLQRIVMDVYMRRAGGIRLGKFCPAAPFRYVSAARFLSTHPKFRGDVVRTGASAPRPADSSRPNTPPLSVSSDRQSVGAPEDILPHAVVVDSSSVSPVDNAETVLTDSPSAKKSWVDRRGVGLKSKRAAEGRERDIEKLHGIMTKVGGDVSESKVLIAKMLESLQDSAQREADMVLLTVLPKGSGEYRNIVARLLRRRRGDDDGAAVGRDGEVGDVAIGSNVGAVDADVVCINDRDGDGECDVEDLTAVCHDTDGAVYGAVAQSPDNVAACGGAVDTDAAIDDVVGVPEEGVGDNDYDGHGYALGTGNPSPSEDAGGGGSPCEATEVAGGSSRRERVGVGGTGDAGGSSHSERVVADFAEVEGINDGMWDLVEGKNNNGGMGGLRT